MKDKFTEIFIFLYFYFFNFKYILLIILLHLSHFFSSLLPSMLHLPPQHPSPLSSCPWVLQINSWAYSFPILFLTPPVYFVSTSYALYSLYIFSCSPPHPTDNPPHDLHFCNSVPVLVVCLVCFCFSFLGSVVDRCEFVVILLFIDDELL